MFKLLSIRINKVDNLELIPILENFLPLSRRQLMLGMYLGLLLDTARKRKRRKMETGDNPNKVKLHNRSSYNNKLIKWMMKSS